MLFSYMLYLSHRRNAGTRNGFNIFVLTRLIVVTSLRSPHHHIKINHHLINPSKHSRIHSPFTKIRTVLFKHFCKYKWCLLNYNSLLSHWPGALNRFYGSAHCNEDSSHIEWSFSLRTVTSGFLESTLHD